MTPSTPVETLAGRRAVRHFLFAKATEKMMVPLAGLEIAFYEIDIQRYFFICFESGHQSGHQNSAMK